MSKSCRAPGCLRLREKGTEAFGACRFVQPRSLAGCGRRWSIRGESAAAIRFIPPEDADR